MGIADRDGWPTTILEIRRFDVEGDARPAFPEACIGIPYDLGILVAEDSEFHLFTSQ